MTANGTGDQPKSPASSIASDTTTAVIEEAMNDADAAVAVEEAAEASVATNTTAKLPAPSPEDAADAAAFKEAANKDFKGT